MEARNGSKIPSRDLLSNWMQDKLVGTTPSAMPANTGCGKRTPSSTEDCTGK
jgi:hypothetical protein